MSKMNKNKNNHTKAIDKSLEADLRSVERGSRKELSSVAQKYVRALVDPISASNVGVPTSIGGYPGRTNVSKSVLKFQVKIGTGGVGFAYTSICPPPGSSQNYVTGPFSDSVGVQYTDGTFAGNSIQQQGAAKDSGIAGSSLWPSSYFTTGGAQGSKMNYRVVGHTLKVFPTSSFSSQNGVIHLLEAVGHESMNGGSYLTEPTLTSLEQTRTIRATQTGSQAEQLVVNWHPRTGANFDVGEGSFSDFSFVGAGNGTILTYGSLAMPANGLILFVTGASQTTFEVEVCTMWELRGTAVRGLKPRLVDQRGLDLVFNALASKTVSGYVGKPEHVERGYLAAIWHGARKAWGWASQHEKELMGVAKGAAQALAGIV
jgi:hypothetical protein